MTFVGRPNVGKSTLMNALVGEKIAITSDKPQTTRRAIRGILNRPGGQIVIVDTPGLHRPRTLLGQRLNDLVEEVLGDVDVIAFCAPATEKVGLVVSLRLRLCLFFCLLLLFLILLLSFLWYAASELTHSKS